MISNLIATEAARRMPIKQQGAQITFMLTAMLRISEVLECMKFSTMAVGSTLPLLQN
jgi:hypothetical protein